MKVVFVQPAKCICPQPRATPLYLATTAFISYLLNVFVLIESCICTKCKMYLSTSTRHTSLSRSTEHNNCFYFWFAECICLNWKLYLCKVQNVFVHIHPPVQCKPRFLFKLWHQAAKEETATNLITWLTWENNIIFSKKKGKTKVTFISYDIHPRQKDHITTISNMRFCLKNLTFTKTFILQRVNHWKDCQV